MKNTSKKGFTLVEIMIVVVIIGLLAAMAIPAFQKVRLDSRVSAVENDGRQLASAAQQYMLENNVVVVAHGYNAGALAAGLTPYVRRLATGYTITGSVDAANLGINDTFSISHPQLAAAIVFTAEGQATN